MDIPIRPRRIEVSIGGPTGIPGIGETIVAVKAQELDTRQFPGSLEWAISGNLRFSDKRFKSPALIRVGFVCRIRKESKRRGGKHSPGHQEGSRQKATSSFHMHGWLSVRFVLVCDPVGEHFRDEVEREQPRSRSAR